MVIHATYLWVYIKVLGYLDGWWHGGNGGWDGDGARAGERDARSDGHGERRGWLTTDESSDGEMALVDAEGGGTGTVPPSARVRTAGKVKTVRDY